MLDHIALLAIPPIPNFMGEIESDRGRFRQPVPRKAFAAEFSSPRE